MKKILAVLMIASILLTTVAVTVSSASDYKFIKATSKCNVRIEPNKNSDKIGTAEKGQIFAYDRTKKDSRGVLWYGTLYGSYGTGWISSKNVVRCSENGKVKNTPKPTAKPTPKPVNYSKFTDAGYYVTVTGDSVNMRKEASSEYAVVTACKKGTQLYAVRTNGSWTEVADEASGKSGYMANKYLEKCEIQAPQVTEAPAEVSEPADPGDTTTTLKSGVTLNYNRYEFKVDEDADGNLDAVYLGEVKEGELVGFNVVRSEGTDAKEYMTEAAESYGVELSEAQCFDDDKTWYTFENDVTDAEGTSVRVVYARNNSDGAWIVTAYSYVDEDEARNELISDELSAALDGMSFAD